MPGKATGFSIRSHIAALEFRAFVFQRFPQAGRTLVLNVFRSVACGQKNAVVP